jgi:hypothetical protein
MYVFFIQQVLHIVLVIHSITPHRGSTFMIHIHSLSCQVLKGSMVHMSLSAFASLLGEACTDLPSLPARLFWLRSFGLQTSSVSWDVFLAAFLSDYQQGVAGSGSGSGGGNLCSEAIDRLRMALVHVVEQQQQQQQDVVAVEKDVCDEEENTEKKQEEHGGGVSTQESGASPHTTLPLDVEKTSHGAGAISDRKSDGGGTVGDVEMEKEKEKEGNGEVVETQNHSPSPPPPPPPQVERAQHSLAVLALGAADAHSPAPASSAEGGAGSFQVTRAAFAAFCGG